MDRWNPHDSHMQDTYSRAGDAADPAYLSPEYKSTVPRSPRKPLIAIPQTLSEITGPVYGHSDVRAGSRPHRSMPATAGRERIIVGRVLDGGARANSLIEIWQAAGATSAVDQHPPDRSQLLGAAASSRRPALPVRRSAGCLLAQPP
jgi:protocatechuate 3,4-dioxygenase beta subunit